MTQFSRLAARYVRARPIYPDALFAYLSGLAGGHDLAWDCATSNGQATVALTRHFRRVAATDLSAEQVARGASHAQVDYWVASAEASALRTGTVDLVTVATALHWLPLAEFYEEVERVLKPAACWPRGATTCPRDSRA